MGHRISQAIGTSSPVVTQYLLDTQPGLTKILAQTTGGNTDRFIHSQRGVLAHQDNSGDWFHPVQDGLGSVRGVADGVLAVQGMQNYAPYGMQFGAQGSLGMSFGFTGEQTDANELVYLRARYLNPAVGAFASLDPFEGTAQRPMSLNGYSWVEGQVINAVDPSGLSRELAQFMASGGCSSDTGTCAEECRNHPNPVGCTIVCLDRQREVQEQNIKNASVTISYNDDTSCEAGNEPFTTAGSLGVMTSEGIWTHDHIDGAGANFGNRAENFTQALDFIRSWKCITITGFIGKPVTVDAKQLKVEQNQRIKGALMIQYEQKDRDGEDVSLRNIGIPSIPNPNWNPVTNSNQVALAHIRGDNSQILSLDGRQSRVLFDHNIIGVMVGTVDTSVGSQGLQRASTGRPFYALNRIYNRENLFSYRESIERGDSGGGVFAEGRLVGFNFSVFGEGGWNSWFAPTFVPYRLI